MEKNQHIHFRYMLEQLRHEHMEVIDDMLQGVPHGYRSHEDSELSRYDNHPAEIATELFDAEHNAALKESEEFTIREIDDALNRIKDGTYGICENCGRQIDRDEPYEGKQALEEVLKFGSSDTLQDGGIM